MLHVKQVANQRKSNFVSQEGSRISRQVTLPSGFTFHPGVCCSLTCQCAQFGKRLPRQAPVSWPPYRVPLDGMVAVVQLRQVLEVVELAKHHILLGRICGVQWEGRRAGGRRQVKLCLEARARERHSCWCQFSLYTRPTLGRVAKGCSEWQRCCV